MKDPYLRILDANYNRAKEALRVAEDLARFFLNRRALALAYKKSRHDLTKILLKMPVRYCDLLKSRDIFSDVGRKTPMKDKASKTGWPDIMRSNIKRSQEALRVLEEVSRVLFPKQARSLEDLRFRLYELETKSF